MRTLFLFGLAALAAPLTSQAQYNDSTPYRPFYVGVGANLGSYWLKWGGGYIREPFSFSPALAVGIALRSNIALQARITAYEQRSSNSFTYTYPSPGPNGGQVTYTATAYRNRIVVVPLLLRYTFTQASTRRLQADLLLGINIISTRARSSSSRSDSTHTVIASSSDGYSALNRSLTYGASLRYALTPHVELATELLTSLHFVPYGIMPNRNVQMELRYRFGPVKGGN